jgi:hypothetical protein
MAPNYLSISNIKGNASRSNNRIYPACYLALHIANCTKAKPHWMLPKVMIGLLSAPASSTPSLSQAATLFKS